MNPETQEPQQVPEPATQPVPPPQPVVDSTPPAPVVPSDAQTLVSAPPPPQEQVAVTNQPMQVANGAAAVQDHMRRTILKIIGIMSALSLVVVFIVFLLSGAADGSLSELESASNAQAEFSVPTSWSEDNVGDFVAYYNQGTLEASQATYLVVRPVRISFDSDRISDAQMLSLTEQYRRRVNESEVGATLSDPEVVEVQGFYRTYDLSLTGVADDGRTEIRGISRVMFDDSNFAHTVEFVAVRSYWEANETEILTLINSYALKDSQ